MSELDGESSYRISVNGAQIGTAFQNPETTIDYSPASVTFNQIYEFRKSRYFLKHFYNKIKV